MTTLAVVRMDSNALADESEDLLLSDRLPTASQPVELVDETAEGSGQSPPTQAGGGLPRIVVRAAAAWNSKPHRPTRLDAAGCWIVRDGLGAACVLLAWGVMLYAEVVVLRVIVAPAPPGLFRFLGCLAYNCLMALALVAHLKCVFSDPGSVPLHNATRENFLRLGPLPDGRDRVVYKCARCDCVKPERTHHCSVCDRCVRRMDHHCPWINNCVGLLNQKYFVLFTGYISLCSFFSIYLCLHYFAICLGTEWEACNTGPSPAVSTFLLLVLIVLSLLFGMFTAVMAGSQVGAILTNTTGIEKIKGQQRSTKGLSRVARLEVVFGHPFTWRWLSPFHAPRLRPDSDSGCVEIFAA